MYNHAPKNYICPFCSLIKGVNNEEVKSVKSDIVYQDKRVTAFISLHQCPKNRGAVVIVPNEHFENIYDLPEEYAIDIQRIAKRIAIAMKSIYTCDGVSTQQHNEPAGNQDVWHYHLHIAPRYKDDNYYLTRGEPIEVNDRALLANKYIDFLSKKMR
jgi:histidine triad (HIT) family protein